MKWNLERCGIGATVHVLQYRTEILQLLSKVHGLIRLFLRRQDFLSAYPINNLFEASRTKGLSGLSVKSGS